jgi:hypothetical protein
MFKQYFKGWGFNLQGELRKKRGVTSEELSHIELIEENDFLDYDQMTKKS